ncbi:MAG: NUDIX hydrolase [Spirochaetes bacterium]|nr:MAG: NUDIX hydrolase [Spirochaetota bacterium]
MALDRWKTLSTKLVIRNPWWSYILDTVRGAGGREGEYHFVRTPGSVIIVPVRDDGAIVMVRQYRYLMERESLEFPAGGMKEGEAPAERARRELIEETGMDGSIEFVGRFNPCKGIIDEWSHVFIARDLMPSNEFHKDDSEEFEIDAHQPSEIDRMIRENEIADGMTMAAWAMVAGKV